MSKSKTKRSKPTTKPTPHIVIWMNGGVVDSVASPFPLDYTVVDEDITGTSRSDQCMIDGRRVWFSAQSACVNAEQVEAAIRATERKHSSSHKCADCGSCWHEDQLREIQDLMQRVAPGEIMPSGECPDCGALCHPKKKG